MFGVRYFPPRRDSIFDIHLLLRSSVPRSSVHLFLVHLFLVPPFICSLFICSSVPCSSVHLFLVPLLICSLFLCSSVPCSSAPNKKAPNLEAFQIHSFAQLIHRCHRSFADRFHLCGPGSGSSAAVVLQYGFLSGEGVRIFTGHINEDGSE